VASGNVYVGDHEIDRRRRGLKRSVETFSLEKLQEKRDEIESNVNRLKASLDAAALAIDQQPIGLIRSSEGARFLDKYIRIYNSWKIATSMVEEIDDIISESIHGKKEQRGLESKRTRKRNPLRDAQPENQFLRRGGGWMIRYMGKESPIVLPHLKGLTYIARLLKTPNELVNCSELISIGEDRGLHVGELQGGREAIMAEMLESGSISITSRDTPTEIMDEKARKQYGLRLKEIIKELDDPDLFPDVREKLEEEKEELFELLQSTGRRVRKTSDGDKRLMSRVGKAIKEGIRAIGEYDTDLAAHLTRSLKGGIAPTYIPHPEMSWHVELVSPRKK
jgi:hypothetical protein